MNPYATDKLAQYPQVIEALRAGSSVNPITVHLMPQNVCNQSCEFCSYRLPDNKNSSVFDAGATLPWDALQGLIADFDAMGVQGVELTGGGEPLAHPQAGEIIGELHSRGIAVGLVTNGTLGKRLPDEICKMLRWVRVSLDAGYARTYGELRRCKPSMFLDAVAFIERLAAMRSEMHPEFKLGAGFTCSRTNALEIEDFVAVAKASGCDNVRLSICYSDKKLDYFDVDALDAAIIDARIAKDEHEDSGFAVHDLMAERANGLAYQVQDYRRCPTKDVLCVVEGEGWVYTCCTFTGSARGRLGNILEHKRGFRGVWEESAQRRKDWDSREECKTHCLYRERNIAMNALIDNQPTHREFI